MFRSFKEALYHSCEHGFLEIAMELRSLGKNELCITSKSVFRMSIIKAKKTSKKIYLKGQGDRVIQSEDNENMNLGVDIPRGGSSCPLFPGQVDFGNVKIFWRVGNRRTYIYIYIYHKILLLSPFVLLRCAMEHPLLESNCRSRLRTRTKGIPQMFVARLSVNAD